MTTTAERKPRHLAARERSRLGKNLMTTLPIVLVGSMAVSMNLTGPIDVEQKRPLKDKAQSPSDRSQDQADLASSIRQALAKASAGTTAATETPDGEIAIAAAPATYKVRAGDTVSSIAGRHGLSTASVLALNGLGWKSIIYPGQLLTLSTSAAKPIASTPKAAAAAPQTGSARYRIVSGDTIGKIAARHKVSTQSVLAANGLGWKSIIYPGQTITIPGRSAPATVAPPVPVSTPQAPAATPPQATSNASHLIKSGDTVSSIATRHGVTIQAILNANGLNWSSIIYAGRTLTIPGVAAPASTGTTITPMNDEMRANAAIIIGVGKQLGVNDYGLVISLATAMQESTLRNLDWGDRDSLGLFQQRPSTGWGTPAQVTDPGYASRLFFGGPGNPNKGITRGLLDIPGWQSMTVTQAAQAVQISAYPDAYAKWEASAWVWLDQLT
ncbi:MAG: LysM peptidoglycan-binding domain-containing protein [Homoserinimonas sp.]